MEVATVDPLMSIQAVENENPEILALEIRNKPENGMNGQSGKSSQKVIKVSLFY